MSQNRPSVRDPFLHRHYPWAPVEAFLRATMRAGNVEERLSDVITVADFADAVGVDRRYIQRWRKTGLTEPRADQIATRLEVHMSLFWPEYWDVPVRA